MKRRRDRCPMCRGPHVLLRGETIGVLRRTPGALAREVRRVPRRLAARRPSRREWAVSEVVAHLADAELAMAFRLRKIAAESRPLVTPWDQEAWAAAFGYRTADPRARLAVFQVVRRANLNALARAGRARRRRVGRHPEYGRITLDQLLAHYAEHDLNHLGQIRRIRAALAAR